MFTAGKSWRLNSLTSCLQIRDLELIDNTLFAAIEGGIYLAEQENKITNIDDCWCRHIIN